MAFLIYSHSAFCALPDSVQFEQGSQIHSFRIREQFTALSSDKRPPKNDGFIYGFSHFIQRRDSSSKRGYQQVSLPCSHEPSYRLSSTQRSLVILTQHQFPAFFTYLASILGPLFEQYGTTMLEAACHSIAAWYVFINYLVFNCLTPITQSIGRILAQDTHWSSVS